MTDEKIREAIEEFKAEILFPKLKAPDEIEFILALDRTRLKNRMNEDLAMDSIQLAQYALYLKSQSNRYKSVAIWCNANIDSIIGREINNTNGYGYKEKSVQILRSDKDARRLRDMLTYAEVKVQFIEDLDRRLEFMANSIKGLIFARKQEYGN